MKRTTVSIESVCRAVRKAVDASPLLRRRLARDWKFDVTLVSQMRMIALNAKYRGKKCATDVLSFPAPEPFYSSGILGEVVICTSVMKKQARQQGYRVNEELAVLLVHGVLHLLGFDHERGPGAERAMKAWESRILKRMRLRGLIARANYSANSTLPDSKL